MCEFEKFKLMHFVSFRECGRITEREEKEILAAKERNETAKKIVETKINVLF